MPNWVSPLPGRSARLHSIAIRDSWEWTRGADHMSRQEARGSSVFRSPHCGTVPAGCARPFGRGGSRHLPRSRQAPAALSSHSGGCCPILEGFRTRTGNDPEWPSAPQRAHLYAPIFGDAFRTTSIDLRSAARAFAERGTEMTQARRTTTDTPLCAHLRCHVPRNPQGSRGACSLGGGSRDRPGIPQRHRCVPK